MRRPLRRPPPLRPAATRSATAPAACAGLAAALLLALAGCRERPAPRPSILWVAIDTLRADHLEQYGYERITAAGLAPLLERGALFEHATTPHPETTPALAAALTGLYPPRNGVRGLYLRLHDSNRTAAENLLAAAGYDTAAFVSSFVMIDDFNNFGQGFGVYEDRVSERELNRENYERKAELTVALARDWLDRRRQAQPGDRPYFLFLHLIDPHGPYTPPGAWSERFRSTVAVEVDGEIPAYQQIPGVRDANRYRDRYDGEIAYAMAELAKLLADLERRDELDDALVVLTADHGESMGERGIYFRHGGDVFDENVRVPLLIKPPRRLGLAGGIRVGGPVSLVDLLPTTLALAGVRVPDGLDGASLVPALSGERLPSRPLLMWAGDSRQRSFAIVEGGTKAMLRAPRDGSARFDAFDLAADPGEIRPQPVPQQLRRRLQRQLRRWSTWNLPYEEQRNFLAQAQRGDFVRRRLSAEQQEDLERLKSLGYVQ